LLVIVKNHTLSLGMAPNNPCTGRRWRGPQPGRVFPSLSDAATFTPLDGVPAAPVTVPLGGASHVANERQIPHTPYGGFRYHVS
jgi:hypothetical protein